MITLMVNVYAEDPAPAIESAHEWLPIDREIIVEGRYEGFPEIDAPPIPNRGRYRHHYRLGHVWPSEHAKRNAMLQLAGEPDGRWLFWLDCDERVTRASPQIALQLERFDGDVAGIRFVQPLPPDLQLAPGLLDPRRRARDLVNENFGLRLYRHLPGLEYLDRHDALWRNDRHFAGYFPGSHPADPGRQVEPSAAVDVEVVHLWWAQSAERLLKKRAYYHGPERTAETHR